MKPQVRWTSREWALLAQFFIDTDINPDAYGFSRVLDQAQKKVLPSERHRSVSGVPAQLKKEIKTQIGILEHARREEATMVKPPEPKPPSAESLSTEDLLVELARRVAKLLQPRTEVQDSVLAQLKFLEEKFKDQPVDRAFFPPPTAKEQGTKQEKTRILIIGPRAEQQEALRVEFPMLCLRFVTAEEHPRMVFERGCTAIEIIIWTKFLTHAQQNMAKNMSAHIHYANSNQQIRERLTTWATT